MAEAASSRRRPVADVTALVGRRNELVEVKQLLAKARLVTLTGVAGVGKTRLGHHVADQLRQTFPDGVCFVELAPVRDPELLPHTVAMALEAPSRTPQGPLADLTDHLRDKKALLVIDNCEHMVDACAEVVGALLRGAPRLRVLATSRQPLGIIGEHVWSVPPLPTPVESVPPAGGEEYPSLSLFAQHAATALPEFMISVENRDVVGQICHHLDGIPLGIKLAAARLGTLSLEKLLNGLRDRHELLHVEPDTGSPPYQTLREAIDWSFDLCSADEQLMWERVSVFPAGFDLDAAEQVCGGDGVPPATVVELVTGLVDKSILFRDDRFGRTQYRLLDTLRQYGLAKLRASGQDVALRRRHRDWSLRLVEEADTEWFGSRQAQLFNKIQSEHSNIRAALEFSLSTPGETRTGLSMATTLWFYWLGCGLLPEGRYWLNRALRVSGQPCPEHAKALWVSGVIAAFQGHVTSATAMADQCCAYAAEVGDGAALARGTQLHGLTALLGDDLPRAAVMLAEARDLLTEEVAKQSHDHDLDSLALLTGIQLATARTFQGDPVGAAEICDQCRASCERRGERWVLSYALYVLALTEWQSNRLPQAAMHAREALRIKRTFYDLLGMVVSVDLLAWIAAAGGDSERAAVLLGASHHMWGLFGRIRFGSQNWSSPHSACQVRCRIDLGEHAFETAHRRGGELTTAQTVAYAIAD